MELTNSNLFGIHGGLAVNDCLDDLVVRLALQSLRDCAVLRVNYPTVVERNPKEIKHRQCRCILKVSNSANAKENNIVESDTLPQQMEALAILTGTTAGTQKKHAIKPI